MTLDFYAYWNGAQIRDLFEALVAITSGPSYQGLIKSAVLAGFLLSLTAALLRWQGTASKIYLFAALLFYSILLVPKTDLVIQDVRSSEVHTVSNVPFGAGFFASAASRIGHFLTESFEGAFSLPDSERYSRFGAVFPQRALSALLNAGILTPKGRAMTDRVIAGCIAPELMDYPGKVTELANSASLWKTVSSPGWVNPARNTLDEEGSPQSCEEAVTALDEQFNQVEVDFLTKRLGALLVPERTDPSGVIAKSLPHAEALLLGLSRSLQESLKHSVMLTSLPKGLAGAAAQASAPLDLAVKLSASGANLTGEINYRTLAKIAEQSLPKIRNAVEFIVIAAFPLSALLMVAAGTAAGPLFRSFCVLLIWLELWAPLSSVVNYLLINADAHPMSRLVSEFGGSTLLAADLIREAGASSQAIAGGLMMLIPVIAFALAKGSDMAFVSMASSLMGTAAGAAQSVSAQIGSGNIASGNVSLGNRQMNSVSGNKADHSVLWSDPYAVRTQTAYGAVTRDESGIVTGMQRTGIDLGISTSSTLASQKSSARGSSVSSELAHNESRTLSVSSASTLREGVSQEFARALSEGIAERRALTEGVSKTDSAAQSTQVSDSYSGARALSTSESFAFTSRAGLSAGAGEMLSAGSVQIPQNSAPSAQAPRGASPQEMSHPQTKASRFEASEASTIAKSSEKDLGAPSLQTSYPEEPLLRLHPSQTPDTPTVEPSSLGLTSAQMRPFGQNAKNSAQPQRTEAAPGKGFSGAVRAMADGVGVGINLEGRSAQQLMDTAAQTQTAANALQRAQAYAELKSVTSDIAKTSSDEGLRRAAQSFSLALDQAYRAGSDRSASSSESHSAQQNVSESLASGHATALNHDVRIMNKTLSSGFGSAENALRRLFHSPQAREEIGSFSAAVSESQSSDPKAIGKAQVTEDIRNVSELRQRGLHQIRSAAAKHSEKLPQETEQTKTAFKTRHKDLIPASGTLSQKDFESKFEGRERTWAQQRRSASGGAEGEARNIKEQTLRYQTQEKSPLNVLSIALAGGAGYEEPIRKREAKSKEAH